MTTLEPKHPPAATRLSEVISRLEQTLRGTSRHADERKQVPSAERVRLEHASALRRLAPWLPDEQHALLASGALTPTPALTLLERWAVSPKSPSVVLITGPQHSGKTLGALAVCASRAPALCVRAVDLLGFYGVYHGEPHAPWQHLVRARMLVIDNLNPMPAQASHARLTEALTIMLDLRARRRTIITSRRPRANLVRLFDFAPLVEQLTEAALLIVDPLEASQ